MGVCWTKTCFKGFYNPAEYSLVWQCCMFKSPNGKHIDHNLSHNSLKTVSLTNLDATFQNTCSAGFKSTVSASSCLCICYSQVWQTARFYAVPEVNFHLGSLNIQTFPVGSLNKQNRAIAPPASDKICKTKTANSGHLMRFRLMVNTRLRFNKHIDLAHVIRYADLTALIE